MLSLHKDTVENHPLTASGDGEDGGPVELGILNLVYAAVPLLCVALVSVKMQLDLHSKIIVAMIRCAGQLSLLGWILVPIFNANVWWMTLAYSTGMVIIASAEAASRPQYTYSGAFFTTCMVLGVVGASVISFALFWVIGIEPWYDPQYLIPMLGMLLGNSCSTVSVGLSSILNEFASHKDSIELLLSFGATRMEATRDVLHRSIQLAMTPLLNSMSVVGIVSIPGMMTGQILGGSDPSIAARYQIVIFFLIGVSGSVSAMLTILIAVLSVFDSSHRVARPPTKRQGWWFFSQRGSTSTSASALTTTTSSSSCNDTNCSSQRPWSWISRSSTGTHE